MKNNDILTPFLQVFGKQALSLAYDISGNIIYVSESWNNYFTSTPPEIFSPSELIKIKKIRHQVIDSKKPISFLSIYDINCLLPQFKEEKVQKHFMIYYTFYPSIDERGELISTFLIGEIFQNINLFDVFRYGNNAALVEWQQQYRQHGAEIPNLSKRELEILFFVINGLSQRDIAIFLNITRGTVSKIITEKIVTKLGLGYQSTELIIKKGIELGVHLMVPERLLRSTVIELGVDEV